MSDPSERPTQSPDQVPEPCRSCAAPLAADQRYCLNCGQRRGGPRVDFRQHLPATGAAANGAEPAPSVTVEQPPAPAAGPEKPQRDYTPLAAVGGIAILGLMLLVGVLIGKGDSPATTAPQVIVPAEAGDVATAADDEATAEKSTTVKGGKSAKVKGKQADDADSLTSGKGGAGPVVASDEALQELEEDSGSSYSEKSAKLPDEIATGGAPPPTDDKAPGGGSKGTAIE